MIFKVPSNPNYSMILWVVASLPGSSDFRRPLVCGGAVLVCSHPKMLQKRVLARCLESKLIASLGRRLQKMF